jgi:hypothetical protein
MESLRSTWPAENFSVASVSLLTWMDTKSYQGSQRPPRRTLLQLLMRSLPRRRRRQQQQRGQRGRGLRGLQRRLWILRLHCRRCSCSSSDSGSDKDSDSDSCPRTCGPAAIAAPAVSSGPESPQPPIQYYIV